MPARQPGVGRHRFSARRHTEALTNGDSLIHCDVRAANLWCHDGRLMLADWASAAIGDTWLDHHLWLVALHAEGGPLRTSAVDHMPPDRPR